MLTYLSQKFFNDVKYERKIDLPNKNAQGARAKASAHKLG